MSSLTPDKMIPTPADQPRPTQAACSDEDAVAGSNDICNGYRGDKCDDYGDEKCTDISPAAQHQPAQTVISDPVDAVTGRRHMCEGYRGDKCDDYRDEKSTGIPPAAQHQPDHTVSRAPLDAVASSSDMFDKTEDLGGEKRRDMSSLTPDEETITIQRALCRSVEPNLKPIILKLLTPNSIGLTERED